MNISQFLYNLQTCLQSHWFVWSYTLNSGFCCNSSTGLEEKAFMNQTKLWNAQTICMYIFVKDLISGRVRRRQVQLSAAHNFLSSKLQ